MALRRRINAKNVNLHLSKVRICPDSLLYLFTNT